MPNIETILCTKHSLSDPTRARLTLKVSCDGERIGELSILSGPAEDIQAYTDGKLTMKQITEKWRMGRP